MKIRSITLAGLLSSSLCISAQALTLANYQAIVLAQSPSNYFTFDNGSLTSVVGSSPVTLTASPAAGSITGLQLAPDVFGNINNSFYFTIGTDVIDDLNESSDHIISGGGAATNTSTAKGSISFLFRSTDPGLPPSGAPGTHCVFAAAPNSAVTNGNAFSILFENPWSTNTDPGALKVSFGDKTTTILAAANIMPDTWYYFALTYNEAATNASGVISNKATWYLGRLSGGGVLTSGVIACNTNSVAGDGASFYICNLTSLNSTLRNPGNGQIDEVAVWNRQLSTNEIANQFTNLPNGALPPRSQYETVVSSQSPAHYFTLDGTPVDSITGLILSTNSMTTNRFGFSSLDYFEQLPGACYFPYGGNDALYTNKNLLTGGGPYTGSPGTGRGAISLLFHALANTNAISGQKFIYSAGGSTSASNGFALFYENVADTVHPAALKLRFGDSDVPILPGLNPALVSSPWYYFAMNYDETQTANQVHWWLAQLPDGTLQSGSFTAMNGSLAGEGDIFVIGNNSALNGGFRDVSASRSSNGQVDQFAIWGRLLTTNEVAAQFNALSVSAGPPPTLNIAVSGANAILSWPSSTDPGYGLQSTTNLASPNWLSAGASAVVGTNNVVTNSISGSAQFYRLKK